MGGNFDRILGAEEVEENAHPFLTFAQAMDNAGEAAHGPVRDFNEVTRLKRCGELFDELAVHFSPNGIDDGVGNAGKIAAELDHVEHALGMADGTEGQGGIEPGEEIAGEEGFDKPNLSTGGGALKFDAGAVGGDAVDAFQHAGGDVFGLGAGVDHIPGGWIGWRGRFFGGHGQGDR